MPIVQTGTPGLPTGAATAVNQQTDALTDTELRATPVPVSGTVTANAGTNLNTSALALETGGNLAAAATSLGALDNSVDGNYLNTNMNIAGVDVDGNSGSKSAQTVRVVLATDQPALTNKLLVTPDLPSGAATAAKQPALGTAGTSSADVITVQGRTSMTPILTDGSATTQPVSGTVTANAGTNLNTSALATSTNLTAGTQKTQVVDGSGNVIGATSNALDVNIKSGAGSGGTAMSDDAAFTVGTTSFTPGGGTYKSTRDAVDDNDGGAFAITPKRGLYTSLETPNADSVMDDTLDTVKVSQGTAANLNATVVGTGTFATQSVVSQGTATNLKAQAEAYQGGSAVASGNPLEVNLRSSTVGVATSAKQDTMITSLQLLDDVIFAEDAGHTTGDKGIPLLTVRNDAGGSLAGSDGDYHPLTTDATGALRVDLNGTLSSNNSSTATLLAAATFTGTADDCLNYNEIRVSVIASHASGTDGLSIQQSSDGTNWDIVDTYTISATTGKTFSLPRQARYFRIVYTNGGTNQSSFRLQTILNRLGNATSSQRASDAYTNETDLDQSQAFLMGYNGTTWDRLRSDTTNGLDVDVVRLPALVASTAAIGKLAANSGVDIGDVDITSISAGANLVGDVGIQPRTTNGLDTLNSTSSDGGTALTNTAQAIKASAGKLYGYYIYNPNATAQFVQLYNTASGSVTVGTTNPLFMLTIPATSAANLLNDIGITFSTALSWAATSTAGGNGAPGTALDAVAFYK